MHEGSAKTARSMVISRCVSEESCVICWMVVGCPYPLTGVTGVAVFCFAVHVGQTVIAF